MESSTVGTGQPLLAALPILLEGGQADDALLADGMLEDICRQLARFRTLRIISPVSAGVVASLTDHEIGKRLGASHVLRCRMRMGGASIQLSATLSKTSDSTQIWSERLEVPVEAVSTLEGELIGRIAAALNTGLQDAALTQARRQPANSDAYTLTVHGFVQMREGTLAADEAARALFEQALQLDPAYARAHAGIALTWFNEWSCHWWDRFEEASRQAYNVAHRALAIDDEDAHLHQVIGKLHLFRRDYERATWYFDRAIALCPNDAELLIQQAVYESYVGRPEIGIEYAARAKRLNPYHPNYYLRMAATAHLIAGDAETAVGLTERSERLPAVDDEAFWAVAYAHLGRLDEARAHFNRYEAEFREKILFGRDPSPGESIRWFVDYNPFRLAKHTEFFLDGFSKLNARLPKVAAGPSAGTIALVGGNWEIEFGKRRIILPDLRGLHDICRLVEQPDVALHCLDLSGRELDYSGDQFLDDKARGSVKSRIAELQQELDEAEAHQDIGRAAHLREELDRLLDALARALGLGGRSRKLGDLAERARSAVTWRIRHAIRRAGAVHPDLGRHLSNSIRTGTFCVYRPEGTVKWRTGAK